MERLKQGSDMREAVLLHMTQGPHIHELVLQLSFRHGQQGVHGPSIALSASHSHSVAGDEVVGCQEALLHYQRQPHLQAWLVSMGRCELQAWTCRCMSALLQQAA